MALPTRSLTSANAVFLLTITGLYDIPVSIQGFSSDTAFTEDALITTEAVMGVDGHMSAGVVLHPTKMKISIMPDQPSIEIFNTWHQAQQLSRTVFFADGIIELPSTLKTYTLNRGVLTSMKQVPDAKKMLSTQEFEITWESISVAEV